MENIVDLPHNRGALPRGDADYEELQITDGVGSLDNLDNSDMPDERGEFTFPGSSGAETDKPEDVPVYTHVRTPELRRSGTRILMGMTAVCGAVAGAVAAFSGKADPAVLETLSKLLVGEFGTLFWRSAVIGVVFLAAELLLGFFALGDWLVWPLPLCYAMGTALKVVASGTGVLLPSAAAGICAVTFAAATSAEFSQTLMRLSKGGTVYLDSSPRRSYALAFFGYAVIIAAAAVYEGVALNWS